MHISLYALLHKSILNFSEYIMGSPPLKSLFNLRELFCRPVVGFLNIAGIIQ